MSGVKLTPAQLRIVGSLIEKEMATPDNYPLTMKGLLAACNQTSNRSPVVRFEEPTVANALENLRATGVVRIVYSRSNRTDKYRHVLDEVLGLEAPELALLSVLMLRGPQTASELRTRSERLHDFAGPEDVEHTLRTLASRPEPLVTRLERQPGQREERWAQLLGGTVSSQPPATVSHDVPARTSQSDRLASLEARLEHLESEFAALRADLDAPAIPLAPRDGTAGTGTGASPEDFFGAGARHEPGDEAPH